MPKKVPCLFCPKDFDNIEDVIHHMELDHLGIESETLADATPARETKKQLGDYLKPENKGIGLECPRCFEMFDNIEQIIEHGIKEHDRELDPEFIKSLQNMIRDHPKDQPICERCHKSYLGIITTKINDKVQPVCFNCYEEYFGTNALARITMGTPDDMILKMRTPIS